MSKSKLSKVATQVAEQLVADPYINVSAKDADYVETVVQNELQPTLQHLTNNEPWYQSRVTWGAIFSGVAGLASIGGVTIDKEDIDTLTGIVIGLGSVIGAGVTLYGRWRARKPIGA